MSRCGKRPLAYLTCMFAFVFHTRFFERVRGQGRRRDFKLVDNRGMRVGVLGRSCAGPGSEGGIGGIWPVWTKCAVRVLLGGDCAPCTLPIVGCWIAPPIVRATPLPIAPESGWAWMFAGAGKAPLEYCVKSVGNGMLVKSSLNEGNVSWYGCGCLIFV